MKQSPESLTAEQSLNIITQMISNTKRNIQDGSFYFLLWGWVTALGNIGHYILWQQIGYQHPYVIWLITIPAWIVSLIYGKKQAQKARVRTYGDRLIMWIWVGFSITAIIVIFSGKFGSAIPGLILLLAGLSAFLTGLILQFKPLIIGGSLFWVFAPVALAFSGPESLIISAIAIITGYLIPGYLLKNAK